MKKIWTGIAALLTLALTAWSLALIVGPSPEERFAFRLVAALNEKSEFGLRALLLEKTEFAGKLWHHLPVSSPSWNVSLDDVWELYEMKRGAGVLGALRDWGGKDLTFEAIQFEKGEKYGEYFIRRNPVIIVRTPNGERQTIESAGPVVLIEGEYKLLAFRR